MKWRPPSLWQGGECWILGGGLSWARELDVPEDVIRSVAVLRELPPSTFSPYLSPIHDKHVIGINNAYQIGPWIDVLFFGDCSWYLVHRRQLIDWPGLKVTSCNRFERGDRGKHEGIKYLARDKSHKKGISRRLSKGWRKIYHSNSKPACCWLSWGIMKVIHKKSVFEDARGQIIDILENEPIECVTIISSKKGMVRGNHYHKDRGIFME